MWVLLFTLVGPAFQRLHAQAATGGLTGSVMDATGAAIAGAQITFKNEATGITAQVSSSSVGVYAMQLAPGTYDISAAAPGFKNYVQTKVLVEVGTTPTVNIHMGVGSANETVEVASSNAIEINTTQPQLDSMLPPKEVTDLPLEVNGNIRQINSFATLAPGVRSGPYGSVTIEGGNPGQINSAGTYYNGLQLDTSSAVNSNPPYEMVDEFRVLRSTFSARYGLVQGAVAYNMRSGTNKLHGDGFLIDRNSVFDSKGFFPMADPVTGSPIVPPDQEKDWGATVGGPVVLPHLYNGHNKTFFLGSFDLFNKTQANTGYGTVPTGAMKQGDFSSFVDAKGNLIPIYDPQTGQPFKDNQIPTNRFDPLSKSLLQYLPDPNAKGDNFGLVNNMNPVVAGSPTWTRAYGVTLTHQLTPTQNLAFSWWRNQFYVVQQPHAPIVPVSNPLSSEQSGVDLSNVWLVNYTKIVSSNLVMTAGFAAENKMQNYKTDNENVSFAGVVGSNTMPIVTFNGQNAISGWGNTWGGLVQYYVDNIGENMFNNWMWTKGRNTFNIGGEYHLYTQHTISNYGSGQFNFNAATTSIPNTNDPNYGKWGSSFASFLLGEVDSASRSAKTEEKYYTQDLSSYIQDDIKLTNKLNVSAGLRWDIMVPYVMTMNNDVFLNMKGGNPLAGNLPGVATEFGSCAQCAGYNRAAIHWGNFGPHFGFAYSFDNKTVLQAGYYINFLGFNSAYGQGEGLGGPVAMAGLLGGSFTVNGTGSYVPGYGEWTNTATGAPVALPNVSTTPFSQGLGVAQTLNYFDPNQNGQAPMYQAWNASLQRQLGWNTLVTLAYSANRVTHLAGYNINPISQPDTSVLQYGSVLTQNINSSAAQNAGFTAPYAAFSSQFGNGATVYQSLKNFPQYANVARAFDQAGTTYYNAFQIEADKHVSSGLTFMASLTLPTQYDNLNTAENKYNPAAEYVITSDTYETKIASTYQLPLGQGQRWLNSGRAGRWMGGWEVAGILTYNNGGTLQITQSGEGLMNGLNRPNIVPGTPMWSGNWNKVKGYFEGNAPPAQVFSTAAFQNTGSQYVLGDAKRAYPSIRGPFYPVENLSAQKLFRITEGTSFSVRMDYFNALNRTQMGWPNGATTDINNSAFGLMNSKWAPTNRQGQIMATYNF